MVLIQNFLFHRFIISVAIKIRFLKFNMFNRYKNNTSKLILFFFNFKIVFDVLIIVQACPGCSDGIDPDFLFHLFISQLLLKVGF